ncbi:MAG: hypothetical protein V9F03_05710 [Microthrixaceae bacterium]
MFSAPWSSVSPAPPAPLSAGAPAPTSNITITQQNEPDTWFCLPGWMVLTRDIVNTSGYFELVVRASVKPCSPIEAKAAIYGMPGNGVAWPQTLTEVKDFTISQAGVTRIRFTQDLRSQPSSTFSRVRHHRPSARPAHGTARCCSHSTWRPLSSTGVAPVGRHRHRPPARVRTTPPASLAVLPTSVAAGGTVTVSGLGTPGTSLLVWVAGPAGAAPGPEPVTVLVPESGQWSTSFTISQYAQPDTWTANAQASDCEAVTSVSFTVTGNTGPGPTNPSNPSKPSVEGGSVGNPSVNVGGITAERELSGGAVLNAGLENSDGTGANATGQVKEAKLAWTGSNVRIPLTIGATLLMVGVLILLRQRRDHAPA